MSTLADMTPEQRDNCRGMWCEVKDSADSPAIIFDLSDPGWPELFFPRLATEIHEEAAENVTLRPDLPRAWNPDGSPVEMDVETGVVRSHPRGGVIGSYESPEYVDQPEGTVMRRFVGEWEEE